MGNKSMKDENSVNIILSPSSSMPLYAPHLFVGSALNSQALSLPHGQISKPEQGRTMPSLNSQTSEKYDAHNQLVELPGGRHCESHKTLDKECSRRCDQSSSADSVEEELVERGSGGVSKSWRTTSNVPRVSKAIVDVETKTNSAQVRPSFSNTSSTALKKPDLSVREKTFENKYTKVKNSCTQPDVVLQKNTQSRKTRMDIQNDLKVIESIAHWNASSNSKSRLTEERNAASMSHGRRSSNSSAKTLKPNGIKSTSNNSPFVKPKYQHSFETNLNRGQSEPAVVMAKTSEPDHVTWTDSLSESRGFSIQTESEICSLEDSSSRLSRELLIDNLTNKCDNKESSGAFYVAETVERNSGISGNCGLNVNAKSKREPVESECIDVLTSGGFPPVNLQINSSKMGSPQRDTDVEKISPKIQTGSSKGQVSGTYSGNLPQASDGPFGSVGPHEVSSNFNSQSLVSPSGQQFSHNTGEFYPHLSLSSVNSSENPMPSLASQYTDHSLKVPHTCGFSQDRQSELNKTPHLNKIPNNDTLNHGNSKGYAVSFNNDTLNHGNSKGYAVSFNNDTLNHGNSKGYAVSFNNDILNHGNSKGYAVSFNNDTLNHGNSKGYAVSFNNDTLNHGNSKGYAVSFNNDTLNHGNSKGYAVSFNNDTLNHGNSKGYAVSFNNDTLNHGNRKGYAVNNSKCDPADTNNTLKSRSRSLQLPTLDRTRSLALFSVPADEGDDDHDDEGPHAGHAAAVEFPNENRSMVRSHKMQPSTFRLSINDKPGKECIYHAYLLVPNKDETTFGRPFLMTLESWDLCIFFPSRELILTGPVYENMAKIVKQRCNGKVIVVVSKNLSESDECRFLTTFTRTLDPDARKRNIIPVHIDKNIPDLPSALHGLAVIHYNQSYRRGWLKKKILGALECDQQHIFNQSI